MPVRVFYRLDLWAHRRAGFGSNGVLNVMVVTVRYDFCLVASGINTQRINCATDWQRPLTRLTKCQVILSRRYITFTEVHRHDLSGLCNMPHHRHKPFVAVVCPLCVGFMRDYFRRVDIPCDFLATMQSRLRYCSIHLNPGIAYLRVIPHSAQPISPGCRFGNVIKTQYGAQCIVVMEMPNIVQMKAAFVMHPHKSFNEGRGWKAAIASRWREVFINTFGQLQRVHQLSNGQ